MILFLIYVMEINVHNFISIIIWLQILQEEMAKRARTKGTLIDKNPWGTEGICYTVYSRLCGRIRGHLDILNHFWGFVPSLLKPFDSTRGRDICFFVYQMLESLLATKHWKDKQLLAWNSPWKVWWILELPGW